MKLYVISALLVLSFVSISAFEPVPITLSGTMDKVIFDGKWTHDTEWKASSLNTYDYDDNTKIILRSAHQGDYVYIFLDPITDSHPDKLLDYAIVCFDTMNNKSVKADGDDYCFMTFLDGRSAFTYQGGHTSVRNNFFNKVQNDEEFIAISMISDINDRYEPTPHPSYEFRIPTSLIGRESVYGFYFLVYDDHLKRAYTYPQNLDPENFVTDPNLWGEIYSPDKSLPEFELPLLSLIFSMGLIAIFPVIKQRISGKII